MASKPIGGMAKTLAGAIKGKSKPPAPKMPFPPKKKGSGK